MTANELVAVVGGGVSGLAVARELLRRRPGSPVWVFESEERVGGVIHSERVNGYLCEHAANGFLDAGEARGATGLARDLGVELVPASPAASKRWIWRRGALRAVPAKPPELIRTDLLSWRGKLRLLLEPFARRPPSGDESVASFARRRLGAEAAEAVVGPFVTGIFAGDPERLSVRSALPRLAALESQHGGLLRGMIASRRRGGGRRLVAGLIAPREGVGALPIALQKSLGGVVRTGRRVEAVFRSGAGFAVRFLDGETIQASRVVLATPPWVSADLVSGLDAKLADELRRFETVCAAIAYVGLRRADVPHPLDGFGFLVANGEALRCLGCVFESSIWPGRAPDDHVLLRVIYGGAREPGAARWSDDELRDVVRKDLETSLGIRTREPAFFHARRHARAIPQYNLGHRERVAEVERRAADLGVVLGGNAYHGVAVNDCVDDAARVVERLERAR